MSERARPADAGGIALNDLHQDYVTWCAQRKLAACSAATFADAVSHYGLDSIFDHLILAGGPTLNRMDYGCDPTLYQGGPLNLCPQLTNAPYAYAGATVGTVNGVEATTTCASTSPPQSDVATWTADSIVSSKGNYTYPKTTMSWFECVAAPVNESTGQGKFLIDSVAPLNPPDVSCYASSCSGEAVWASATAVSDTIANMEAKCVPHHQ